VTESQTASPPPLAAIAPAVGFPVTLCVICYGANVELARRFLASLYGCTDAALFILRAGLNEVEAATLELFRAYAKKFRNVELWLEPKNVFKNPLMRRLFHERPITSRWTLWCDDDTHFTRTDWLQRLALKIEEQPATLMWNMLHKLWRRDEFIRQWIEAAPWYRGRPLSRGRDLDGNEATEFVFPTGAFWAVRTSVIRELDWPDSRLVQANDDFLFGEAMRQNDWPMDEFHYGIRINDAPRRNAAATEVRDLGALP